MTFSDWAQLLLTFCVGWAMGALSKPLQPLFRNRERKAYDYERGQSKKD